MGLRAYLRRDGTEGHIHIANVGIHEAHVTSSGRVIHNGCSPGYILQRLDDQNQPIGRTFCTGCKNYLGRKVIPMYERRIRNNPAEIQWEYIPHGARFTKSEEFLGGAHQLLYVREGEIKPIILAEIKGGYASAPTASMGVWADVALGLQNDVTAVWEPPNSDSLDEAVASAEREGTYLEQRAGRVPRSDQKQHWTMRISEEDAEKTVKKTARLAAAKAASEMDYEAIERHMADRADERVREAARRDKGWRTSKEKPYKWKS